MKIENLENLKFYLDAFSAHQKAGKPNSAFKMKLKNLFLLDQIDEEVYKNLINIIGDDEAPAKVAKASAGKGATELPKRERPKVSPSAKLPDPPPTLRKLGYTEGKEFLRGGNYFVKSTDACRGDSYQSATMDDLEAGKQLYTRRTLPSSDPCRGSSYSYSPAETPMSIYPNVSTWTIPQNSSSCGGQSAPSGVSSSCSGGSSSTRRGC